MADEILETPVQEVETTETQESAQTEQEEAVTSEIGEDSTAEQPKKSKGVQKRIDELTAQRHQVEREKETWQQQAEYWRMMAMQPQAPQPQQQTPPAVKPSLDQFENYDDYISSLAKWEAKAIIEEQQKAIIAQQTQYQQQQSLQTFSQREAQFAESTPDYFQVSRNNSVPITDSMLGLIAASDLGPQVAYHLGKNPDIAKRLAQLDQVSQAREFGRLEANLARPVAKKETKAPAPIDPNRGGQSPVTDMNKLSVDQWMEARRKQINS